MNLIHEYGPFDGVGRIDGVAFDGTRVWVACGTDLRAIDAASGVEVRRFPIAASGGTTFDGRYLYQVSHDEIYKIDPETGQIVHSIPNPIPRASTGLTWAEGRLWLGHAHERKILQVEPETGVVLGVVRTDSYVTGVAWAGGDLWHGTARGDEAGALHRVDAATGDLAERVSVPGSFSPTGVSYKDGRFFCGGGRDGRLRELRRPFGNRHGSTGKA